MTFAILMLIVSLGIILLSCALFVNAVEWLGKILNLHQGITGSILAAIGTALPETIIPILAILFSGGSAANHEIGIGAIAGAPFMLGTLGFFVTGSAVVINALMGRRTTEMHIDRSILTRDISFFLIYYGIAVTATFYHNIHPLRWCVALALAASYAIYLKKTIQSEAAEIEQVEDLYATRFFRWKTALPSITIQLLVSLLFIIIGAHFFIQYVGGIAETLGASPLLLSLIITPIATELPEKLNSVLWVGKKKDTLALGNITGAMVFQSCFPVTFGMIFTDWNLRGIPLLSAACALASAALVLAWVKIRKSLNPFILLMGGVFYLAFILRIFVFRGRA